MKLEMSEELMFECPEETLRLPPLLRRSWYRLNQTFRRRIAHLDITPDQYTILRWLTERSDRLSQKALAELMASDPNTIASTLLRMEEAGLISRGRSASDSRKNIVRIEPTGRAMFKEARAIALKLQAEILNCLPARQQASFLRNLERVAVACERAFDETT